MNSRSPRANARRPFAIGLLTCGAAVLAAPSSFAAPTPRECAVASEDASSLQKQEKLTSAKERFLVCADAACPAEIRDECARRVTEVTDAQPSVVFDVKDAAGNDVAAARVQMDGAPLVDQVGPAAVPIDPGQHTFRFETADPSQAVEKSFVVRDGEKNRHLAVTLGGAPPAPATNLAPTSEPAPEQGSHGLGGQKIAAIVVAGVGVIGLGVGAAFGSMAFSQWTTAQNECATSCGASSQAQSDKNTANTSATLSDVGFIAGGLFVAAAAVVWFTAPSGAQVQVVPTASPQAGGLSLRGSF